MQESAGGGCKLRQRCALQGGIVKQRKQFDGSKASTPTAAFKKARHREVGKTGASKTDELDDTTCYSQKSPPNNDGARPIGLLNLQRTSTSGIPSSKLNILKMECALPIVSGFLSTKERACFAVSPSCVDDCEGQVKDSMGRFGVELLCCRCRHEGDLICGCIKIWQYFEFCPDCERIFCGICARDAESNFREMCDVEYCTVSGCTDCRSAKMQTCSMDGCHQRMCKDCGYGCCKGCNARVCGTESCYCSEDAPPECDCAGGVQYDYDY